MRGERDKDGGPLWPFDYPGLPGQSLGSRVELKEDPLLAYPSLAGRQNRLFCASQLDGKGGGEKERKRHMLTV